MKAETEIKKRESELEQRINYLREFLKTCYKGGDAKVKIEKELIPLRRELDQVKWVLSDDELPF